MDVTLLSQTDASVGLFGVRDINGANTELKFIFWSMQTGTQLRSDFFGTSANVTSDVSVIGKRINVDKDKTNIYFHSCIFVIKTAFSVGSV